MKGARSALRSAVDAVADGSVNLDWNALEAKVDSERDRELLRELQILAKISDVQRTESEAVDDEQLESSARLLARMLPAARQKRQAIAREHAARTLDETAPDDLVATMPARSWGRLQLLERIGEGTFGEVYRAFDPKLEREVAVKLLHVGKPHQHLVERVLHEARALARVRHPNVVIVHDAELRDGRVGLCMEFVRGQTLASLLRSHGPLAVPEAARIGQALCRALSAVHEAGLVHRDIKAQNVMREQGGRVVLMDFGTGERHDNIPKDPVRVTGTPLYLAPEVLERGEATVRSDIYSLGVLLYHLVTHDFPVRGRSLDEIKDAHRQGRITHLRDATSVPAWFARVVERATAPERNDRYASVQALEADLARVDRVRFRRPSLPVAAAALGVALAAAVAVPLLRSGPVSAAVPVVALLPLDPGLGAEDYRAFALTDEIFQGLATIDTLRVVSRSVTARLKHDQLPMSEIAKRLGASAVLDGSVSGDGNTYEVKLRLFSAGSDFPSWARTFQASSARLASLRRDAAVSVAGAIHAGVSPALLARLSRPSTASTQAYDAYALGRYLQSRGTRSDIERARSEFERSIHLDPEFAMAYAALGKVHLDLGASGRRSEWMTEAPLARAAAGKAIELDPEFAEALAVMGQVAFQFDWDWRAAETAYERAMQLRPSDDFVQSRYAQFLAARGRVDDALVQIEAARHLNPESETELTMVSLLQYARRFTEAETLALSLRERAPNQPAVHTQLGRIYAATGRFDEAIAEFQTLVDSAAGDAYVQAELASAHAAAGRISKAQEILDRLADRARTEDVDPELFALIAIKLHRYDDAFMYLRRAVSEKSRRLLWIKVDPRLDPLRNDPRFDALVKTLGI